MVVPSFQVTRDVKREPASNSGDSCKSGANFLAIVFLYVNINIASICV